MHRIQKSCILLLLDNPQLRQYFCFEHQFNTELINEMKGLEMVKINSLTRSYTKFKIFNLQTTKSYVLGLIFTLINSTSGSTNS